jgi:ABC-type multidrug transport system permease subunit
MVAATIPMTLKRFLVEYASGLYGSLVFLAAQICVEIPQAALTNLCHLTVTYFMIGLQGNFMYWFFNLFAVSIACNSSGWLISCLSKSTLTAMQLLPIVFLPQILFAGVIVNVSLVPPSVRWLQYFCYLKYIFNLVFLNEFSSQIESSAVVADFASLNNIAAGDRASSAGAVVAIILGLRFIAAVVLSRRARASI